VVGFFLPTNRSSAQNLTNLPSKFRTTLGTYSSLLEGLPYWFV